MRRESTYNGIRSSWERITIRPIMVEENPSSSSEEQRKTERIDPMNTKPITLFLDMDGVLANFESKYEEMFDVQLNKVSEDIWELNWKK